MAAYKLGLMVRRRPAPGGHAVDDPKLPGAGRRAHPRDCYAGGVGLAAVCDIRRRDQPRVQFRLSEARLGLLPQTTIGDLSARAMGEKAARR